MCTVSHRCLILFIVIIAFFINPGDTKCSRLPSGNCWVNCMQDIYDVICNGVTAEQVQSDISVFAHSPQQIRLYIWLSPNITRLSADVFAPVASQIVALDLQDLNLDTFPELYNLNNLGRLNMWASPLLTDFSVELLPASIQNLSLNKLGISNLANDFMESPSLKKLNLLYLHNLTIHSWQNQFLQAFPNLVDLEIANCTIVLSNKTKEFPAIGNLRSFVLSNNNFTLNPGVDTKELSNALAQIFKSLQLQEKAVVDISQNNIPLSDDVLAAVKLLSPAGFLSLRGNPIAANSTDLSGLFQDFQKLQVLDLGETGIAASGLLRGLSSLTELHLDHNNLGSVPDVNVFDGCNAINLTLVDLSFNNLTILPAFSHTAASVRSLNLRNNSLSIFESNRTDIPATQQYFVPFTSLRNLDLSFNNLSSFVGAALQRLTTLDNLDISCNQFKRITKQFFIGLPNSLRQLNLSMCIHAPFPAPFVDKEAFSALPPINIFRMNSAQLKKGIFSALNASALQLANLSQLYLEDNVVTYLSQDNIPHLPHLKLLSLKGNSLQSVQPHTFGNLPELQTLNIANNRISSIGLDNFALGRTSLQNLQYLNIEDNGIDRIERGAFDNLVALKSLLLGNNPAELQDLFITGGSELIYFGMQGYNNSCLRPALFSKLKKLRWLLSEEYTFIVVNPDATLNKRDDYLLSIIKTCAEGSVITSQETYPGLSSFAFVTTHDTDDGDQGMQFPVLATFSPLTYCPAATLLQALSAKICSRVSDTKTKSLATNTIAA